MKRRRIRVSKNSPERIYSTKLSSHFEEVAEQEKLQRIAKKIREKESRRFLLYGAEPETELPEVVKHLPGWENDPDRKPICGLHDEYYHIEC